MSSSGRLTRTVALSNVKDKTEDILSCLGWSLMKNGERTSGRTVFVSG